MHGDRSPRADVRGPNTLLGRRLLPSERPSWSAVPIEHLSLSLRARRVIRGLGIRTLTELAETDRLRLRAAPECGRRTLAELAAVVALGRPRLTEAERVLARRYRCRPYVESNHRRPFPGARRSPPRRADACSARFDVRAGGARPRTAWCPHGARSGGASRARRHHDQGVRAPNTRRAPARGRAGAVQESRSIAWVSECQGES